MQLSHRKQMILASVVELYIETGQPVSSKALIDRLGLSISSATIRNEMLELSTRGYLMQPHTSAGRIPTQEGFRYYIDYLMRYKPLTQQEQSSLKELLPVKVDSPDELLEDVSSAFAEMTGYAALFTTPADEEAYLKRIDVVPLGRQVCMLLFQTTTGTLKTRICRLDSTLSAELVEVFRQIVRSRFEGTPLSSLSLAAVQTVTASLGEYALPLSPLLVELCDMARDTVGAELRMDGESNLWAHGDFGSNIHQLLAFLSRRKQLYDIVSSQKNKVDILIGQESQREELKDSSMILAKYSIGGKNVGSLGLIGPLRLNYAQLVPSVQYLTLLVGELLSDLFELDLS